jgi:osmotically-inducible protein OsmY
MRIATVISIVGILLLAGCSTEPATKAVGRTNADLEQSIKAKLDSDPPVQAANISVTANAAANEATLSGTVSSEGLRLRAVELAKSSQPNLVVTDKIEVKPQEVARNEYTDDMARAAREKAKELGNQIGNSLDDAWLYSKIMARLASDPDTSAVKVNVDVKNKMVTLRGNVDSAKAKTQAERLAKDTDGVTVVRDELTVASGG